jgi:hypothetical protein
LYGRISERFAAFRAYVDEEIAAGRVGADPVAGRAEGALEQAVTDSLSQQKTNNYTVQQANASATAFAPGVGIMNERQELEIAIQAFKRLRPSVRS